MFLKWKWQSSEDAWTGTSRWLLLPENKNTQRFCYQDAKASGSFRSLRKKIETSIWFVQNAPLSLGGNSQAEAWGIQKKTDKPVMAAEAGGSPGGQEQPELHNVTVSKRKEGAKDIAPWHSTWQAHGHELISSTKKKKKKERRKEKKKTGLGGLILVSQTQSGHRALVK